MESKRPRNSTDSSDEKKRPRVDAGLDESTSEEDMDHDEIAEGDRRGIIESISVKNFMKHKNLSLKFGPHLNFIIGKNGSGKSTILAAIQVALGSNAKTTGRGRNLGNLVRKQAPATAKAVVRVTLKNTGRCAYRHEEFGDKIVVQRIIDKKGKTTISLLGKDDAVVSMQKKRDVTEMCSALGIQAANPLAILSQEKTKTLVKAPPGVMYEFFHRATGLADLQAKHEKTKLDLAENSENIEARNRALETSQKAVEEADKRVQAALVFEELEDEIDVLQGKFSWRKVVNVEHKLEDTKQTLKHCEERLQQNKQEQEKSEQEKDAKEKEASASEEILSDYETHMKVLINKQKQNKLRKRDFNQKKKSAERQIALKKKYAADAVANINRLQMQLTALVKKSAAHSASNKSQIRQVEIDKEQQDLDRMVEALSVKQENMNSEEAHLEKVEQHHRNDVEMKQDSLRSIQQNIKSNERVLRNLQSSRHNKLNLYGQETINLQNMLRRENNFHAPPIGPIGMYLKLPEKFKEWAKSIEVCLRPALLQSYIVNDHHDKNLLNRLAKKARFRGSIIIQRYERRFTGVREPRNPHFLTVAGALTVENDNVYNCLVNHTAFQQKILFKTRHEADREMFLPTGQRGTYKHPANVLTSFTMDGSEVQVKGGHQFFSPNRDSRPARFLTENVDGQIESTNRILEDSRVAHESSLNEVEQAKSVLRNVQKDRENLRIELTATERKIARCNRDIHKLIRESQSLQDKEGGDPFANAEAELREEIESAKNERKDAQESVKDANEKLVTLQKSMKPLADEESKTNKEYDQLVPQVKSAHEVVSKKYDAVREVKKICRKLQKKEKKLHDSIANAKKDVTHMEGNLDKAVQTASEFGARPEYKDLTETFKNYGIQLNAKIQELERLKNASFEEDEDIEVLEQNLAVAQANFQLAEKEVGRAKQIQDGLKKRLSDRLNDYKAFRKRVAQKTQKMFNTYLKKKKHKGKCTIDHKKREIRLQIELANSKTRQQDSAMLSGGECSYVTLCLLLAMAESVEMPFRICDEFDVYMDAVARTTAFYLIVAAAEEHKHRQIICITCKDLGDLTKSHEDCYTMRNCKIQTMSQT